MFNTSTLTAKDIQTRFTTQRNETPSDDIVRYAVRHVVDIIDRERWARNQSETRGRTGLLSVTTSGYDLSLITDLGDTVTNFVVCKDSLKQQNQLACTDFMSEEEGYYIEGNTLFLSPSDAEKSVVISYSKKSPRIGSAEALEDYTLPIQEQLEESVYDYLGKTYYDGRFQFELKGEAMNTFLAEIIRVLTVRKRVTKV